MKTITVKLWYADIEKTYFNEKIARDLIALRGLNHAWENIKTFENIKHAFEGTGENLHLEIAEWFFQRTNIGNVLSNEVDQKVIANSKAGHTSMSVSDIIQIDDEFYLCKGAGFEKITNLIKKEVVEN